MLQSFLHDTRTAIGEAGEFDLAIADFSDASQGGVHVGTEKVPHRVKLQSGTPLRTRLREKTVLHHEPSQKGKETSPGHSQGCPHKRPPMKQIEEYQTVPCAAVETAAPIDGHGAGAMFRPRGHVPDFNETM